MLLTSDLHGKGMQSQSHTPAHAILKTHMWYIPHLKYCMMHLPIDS